MDVIADGAVDEDLPVILGWIAASPNDGAAEQEAAALAEELEQLEPGSAGAFADPRIVPDGLLTVLDQVEATALPAVAAALVAACGDRGVFLRLCTAAIGREAERAQSAEDILAPGSVTSTLLVAFGTSGPGLECLEAITAAMDGGLAEACAGVIVPSEITRVMASLHEAGVPFGSAAALGLVEGHFFQRLLATVNSAGSGVPAEVSGAFAEQLVWAGRHAERVAQDGDDPDDPTIQWAEVLESPEALHAAFQAPTPPDPLGTEPIVGVTALGQAIRRARRARPGGYDWGAVLALEESDLAAFGALVQDERLEVLDLAAGYAGIVLSDEG